MTLPANIHINAGPSQWLCRSAQFSIYLNMFNCEQTRVSGIVDNHRAPFLDDRAAFSEGGLKCWNPIGKGPTRYDESFPEAPHPGRGR